MDLVYPFKKCNRTTSECINTVGGFQCKCKKGFLSIKNDCIDVNECKEGKTNCTNNAKCVNYLGSYECECLNGFQISNGECKGIRFLFKTLIKLIELNYKDINECYNGTHECQTFSHCINTIGSYRCMCNTGYFGNGINCEGNFFPFFPFSLDFKTLDVRY